MFKFTNQAEAPIQVKMHSGGNSVMFWGCFSTGPLVSIQGSMNSAEYIAVLKDSRVLKSKESDFGYLALDAR
jgi:hypothetical protein